ncbi:MAG: FlgD immunoglobulin-like domain containing protein, partial [Candidatus Eisenbacteria bacterium]
VTLGVLDVLGRQVRNWNWTALAPGPHTIAWDGRGSSGRLLTPGVYMCRLEFEGQRSQQKLILRR